MRSAGGTRKTRGSQPERDNVAVFVTGDLHGGLDIQKLRNWEADEKHVVLYDNIVALGAGSLSRTVLPHQILTANLLEHMRDAALFKVLPNIAVKEDVWVKQLPLGGVAKDVSVVEQAQGVHDEVARLALVLRVVNGSASLSQAHFNQL